jgi:cobyrinic acid a,c-diamide synthase
MRNIQLIRGIKKRGEVAVMMIEGKDVADKLANYFDHRVSLAELVDWAEQAMMDGKFAGKDWKKVRDIVARIGVADVRAFGLTWEDCERSLMELGYRTEIRISRASG